MSVKSQCLLRMCNRNYVVQYILELELPWASAEVIARLEGNYAHLAMQKFGSNVIEKCLYVATEEGIDREHGAQSVTTGSLRKLCCSVCPSGYQSMYFFSQPIIIFVYGKITRTIPLTRLDFQYNTANLLYPSEQRKLSKFYETTLCFQN